jgi:hypothetical protein
MEAKKRVAGSAHSAGVERAASVMRIGGTGKDCGRRARARRAPLARRGRLSDTGSMNPQSRELHEGVGLTLTTIGALGLLRWARLARDAKRAAQWPIVPREVHHSSLRKTHSMFDLSRSGMGKGLAVYRAQEVYACHVNGVRFEGTQVRLGEPRRERARSNLQDVVSRYPAGQVVQVHHRAERPCHAVLELGLHPIGQEAVAMSGVALTLGLALGAAVWAL